MTATKTTLMTMGGCLALGLAAGEASALGMLQGKEFMPEKYVQRIAAGMKGLESLDNSDQAKGLYSKLVVWPPSYAKLRVCFMGGSDAVNSQVAKVASMWNQQTAISVKLDFGKASKPRKCDAGGRDSQIRISYDQPGYWSQLGQNSVVYTAQEEPSLNLEGFDRFDDPKQISQGEPKGVVLHEFGHALGMLHEHQSPVATCADEFNWEFITSYLKGPPNNWNEETIKFNLAPYGGEDLMMTDFDPQSIMLYSFPANYYLKGEQSSCYIGSSNTDISEADRTTVEFMYPSDAASRAQSFEKAKADMMAIMNKPKGAEASKAISMNYVDAFFGAKGVAADEED